MSNVKICSLFSGIGGFETGIFASYGRKNIDVVFASEINEVAAKSYELIYGHRPHGDITEIDANSIPDHDILVGGFPCQDLSIGGARRGIKVKCSDCEFTFEVKEDIFSECCPQCASEKIVPATRSALFYEIARVARAKRPNIIVLENVKGLLSNQKGETMKQILVTLSNLGYAVDFTLLNSKYFNLAQSRERVYIVAVRHQKADKWIAVQENNVYGKVKRKLSSHPKITPFNFPFPKQQQVNVNMNEILQKDVPEKYFYSEGKTKELLVQVEKEGLPGKGAKQKNKIDLFLVGHINIKGNDSVKRVYSPEGLSPTLTTMGGGHREPKVLVKNELNTDSLYRVRKNTPLECFRLQGFSDDYFHTLVEQKVSDTQLYKMVGNAVSTHVIKALFDSIQLHTKNEPNAKH